MRSSRGLCLLSILLMVSISTSNEGKEKREKDEEHEENTSSLLCPEDCSGRGYCAATGSCVCDIGYGGMT